jgi:PAS domain S-box-containing protein
MDSDGQKPDPHVLLAAIIESSDDAIVSKDLDGIVTSWNRGAERIFGYLAREIIGRSITIVIPEDRRQEETYILDKIRSGERIEHYETVRRHMDGRLVDVSVTVSPIRLADGRIVGASKIARDISDRKKAEEMQRLYLRELGHRLKNLISVIDAIVRQTAAQTSPADLVSRITQRLHALAANQDALIRGDWRGAELHELVRSQLAHISDLLGSRIRIEGASIALKPAAAQALGLTLNELATNALKYGALSNATGVLRISWDVVTSGGGQLFSIAWEESGGPPVAPPSRAGFGSTIIKQITARSFRGDVQLDYAVAGLKWRLTAPADAVLLESKDEAQLLSRTMQEGSDIDQLLVEIAKSVASRSDQPPAMGRPPE